MESERQSLHFKDNRPEETVKKIKKILSDNNIEVEELWLDEEKIIKTSTLRLTVAGTTVGTNGKGVNKIYTAASGYAEFIERLQNDMLINDIPRTDYDNVDYKIEPDERIMTSEEIIENGSTFIQNYCKCLKIEKLPNALKAKKFAEINKIEYITSGVKNKYITVPFYNISRKGKEYLPYYCYRICCGSNGMSAGNTPEEALVQGLSEIIERFVQNKMFSDRLVFPDVPVNTLKKYPYIYSTMKRLEACEGYKYVMKDCSCGGRYPVAALLGININTGKYGIKFGCHPDFGIAMERTLTEATQARNIFSHTRCSIFDFRNLRVDQDENIANVTKVGIGQCPYEFLSNEPTFAFTEPKDVSAMDNKQILKMLVETIEEEGFEILIRDVSFFGFPSYHIIVPGMSEIKEIKEQVYRFYNTQCYVVNKLKNMENIDEDDCQFISYIIRHHSNSYLENRMSNFFLNTDPNYIFPGDDICIGCGALYFASICHVFRKEYDKAAYFMNCILETAEVNKINETVKSKYMALRIYYDGMSVIGDHKKVMEYIRKLFDNNISAYIDGVFCEPSRAMIKIYGNIPFSNSDEYRNKLKVKKIIVEKKQRNPIEQNNNIYLFN